MAIRYHAQQQDGNNLHAWLYPIMRNIFINDYRQQQKIRGSVDVTVDITSDKHRTDWILSAKYTARKPVFNDDSLSDMMILNSNKL